MLVHSGLSSLEFSVQTIHFLVVLVFSVQSSVSRSSFIVSSCFVMKGFHYFMHEFVGVLHPEHCFTCWHLLSMLCCSFLPQMGVYFYHIDRHILLWVLSWTSSHTHTQTHTHTHTCTHAHMHACTKKHTYIQACIHVPTFLPSNSGDFRIMHCVTMATQCIGLWLCHWHNCQNPC